MIGEEFVTSKTPFVIELVFGSPSLFIRSIVLVRALQLYVLDN